MMGFRLLIIMVLGYSTLLWAAEIGPQPFTIGRIKYAGGGDWYADPSSLPNLLARVREDLGINTATHEDIVELTSTDLFRHPYLYLTGHGEIRLTDDEVANLRTHLLAGGFLHADDNYGLDASFRREMARVFPEKKLTPVPDDHALYSIRHSFPMGLLKIHEHDGEPAQSFAYFDGERIMVLYTYSSDLGDGWEDSRVHNDPEELREAALKMGVNIVAYALTH
jgi:hypothetical protein